MAPRSFKNLVVAVSGTFPGYKQADLKAIVEAQGATFSSTVSDTCTHLVATQKEAEKKSGKYMQASSANSNCQIVSLDWLLESVKGKKPLAEKGYLVGAGAATTAPASKKDIKQTDSKTPAKAEKKKTTTTTATTNGVSVSDEAENKKKRGAQQALDVDGDGDVDGPSNKKQKDAQKAGSKTLKVPVDELYRNESAGFKDPTVYIDDADLIWDATLNQTVSSNNANKFYNIQLLVSGKKDEFMTWTRWGRVGEHGQSACLGDGTIEKAMKEFEKKFKDKSGLKWENRLDEPKSGKYRFLEKNYEEDDDDEENEGGAKDADSNQAVKKEKPEVESTLPKSIQNLITFIFNQQHFLSTMAAMSYDANKMPLGKLSERTLKDGFLILKAISELVTTPTLAATKYAEPYTAVMEDLSNRYFTTIPHVFGRNRPPVLDTEMMIRKEVELLEALTDMEVANDILKDAKDAEMINQLDRQFQSLGMEEMARVDPKSTEYKELENYLNHSRGSTHYLRYSVVNIFRIERKGEEDRFQNSPFAKLENSDRRLLWHGSRSTNFGGILSQGLRIAPPEAPVNGYMFGKGVYFADTSSKSANYCCPYNSANMGLLLLCDVELGDPMLQLYGGDSGAASKARDSGKFATHGQGRCIPGGWKDAGCVNENFKGLRIPDETAGRVDDGKASLQYSEYIVYDVAQIRQRYLFQVHIS